jgi:alpha 1,3-glucosidase
MWMQYPQTESLFSLDDQYLIGSDLLVKPVTGEGVTQTTVSFPSNDLWYDVDTSQVVPATTSTTGQDEAISVTVDSDIDKIPVYQRGGSIIPRKLRLRRSTHLMTKDPYTLYVALDKSQKAVGELYMDDEVSFDHDRRKNLALASFSVDFSSGNIANSVNVGSGWTETVSDLAAGRMVERIIVMGVDTAPKSISMAKEQLQFDYSAKSRVLVIRKPNVSALKNWQINITV